MEKNADQQTGKLDESDVTVKGGQQQTPVFIGHQLDLEVVEAQADSSCDEGAGEEEETVDKEYVPHEVQLLEEEEVKVVYETAESLLESVDMGLGQQVPTGDDLVGSSEDQ